MKQMTYYKKAVEVRKGIRNKLKDYAGLVNFNPAIEEIVYKKGKMTKFEALALFNQLSTKAQNTNYLTKGQVNFAVNHILAGGYTYKGAKVFTSKQEFQYGDKMTTLKEEFKANALNRVKAGVLSEDKFNVMFSSNKSLVFFLRYDEDTKEIVNDTIDAYNEYLKAQGISNSYDRADKIREYIFGYK